MSERSVAVSVLLVLAVTAALSVLFTALGVPSAPLFAALLGGMAHALTSPRELRVPEPLPRLAQAVVGVVIGAAVTLPALRRLVEDALPIAVVLVVTLVVSVGAGLLLALRDDVSPITGVFSLIAGGAAGVVAVARDLGADDRVVTVVQYLRVAAVLLTMPVVAALAFGAEESGGGLGARGAALGPSVVLVVVAVVGGLLLARVLRFPTAVLLAPMAVAVTLSLGGWLGPVAVPAPVSAVAFALIGLQVGLRFTRASLASITRMLPTVVALIVLVVAVCAGTGVVLAAVTPVDGLTAYLATTPGGLFAVLATAAGSGSEVTYVTAVQLCRLLVILALLPWLARWLRRLDR